MENKNPNMFTAAQAADYLGMGYQAFLDLVNDGSMIASINPKKKKNQMWTRRLLDEWSGTADDIEHITIHEAIETWPIDAHLEKPEREVLDPWMIRGKLLPFDKLKVGESFLIKGVNFYDIVNPNDEKLKIAGNNVYKLAKDALVIVRMFNEGQDMRVWRDA